MRTFLFIAALCIPGLSSAQIVREPQRPWPCPVPPPCRAGVPCIMPACGIPIPAVFRQSSDVRVDLADRVLRYEITETFVNRGNRVGEADFMFPLPKGAAFQDLKLEINGEMVAGETMNANQARQIYEEIVRRQRDPALLEWMGYGLLRARIFPIAPGEQKKVVVRFQTVAPREGDALRVDYFRGTRTNQVGRYQEPEGRTSFVLTYPNDPMYGTAYSPTHSIYERDFASESYRDADDDRSFASNYRGSVRRFEVRDARGEVTLLIPIRRTASAAISLLANAPGNDDGFALITLSPPAVRPRAVPRDVTFLTDGQPTIGERDASVIAANVAKQRGPRRLFTFGVGADLNVSLIEQLALEGRGTASFVRPEESVERAVGIVASRLTSPLVTDVRVHADGVRLLKIHPSGPVDIFAGEDLVLLARYDGSGNATIRFDGQTTSGPVSWSSRVYFPDRSRENPFVARLWATQRVGYLSAEKRKNGGSREIDDEIRELGERFGIPTEFSSYLVVEPGMNRRRDMGRAGGVPLNGVVTTGMAAAPAAAAVQFEAAKSAAVQRSATNMSMADEAAGVRADANVQRAGNVTFVLHDSVWTDVRYKKTGPVLRVKPFSDAYFKLLELQPDLRDPFSVGDRVIVAGRSMAIELTASGVERLTDRDLGMLRDRW